MLLYVDDMLVASKNRSAVDKLKVSYHLSLKRKIWEKQMEIERDRVKGKVCLTLNAYLHTKTLVVTQSL